MIVGGQQRTRSDPGAMTMPKGAHVRRVAVVFALLTAAPLLLAGASAHAQSWWPFSQSEPPRPKAPVYRAPPASIPPGGGQPGQPQTYSSTPICMQLEQRLIAEGQRGNQSRSQLPQINEDARQTERLIAQTQAQLDRSDCYETFFFSKTLKRTRGCVEAANQLDSARRHLSEISTQRQQLQNTSEHSYQDDIIRELARNGCGANWTQEARKRDQAGFSIFGDTERDVDGARDNNNFGSLPFATYRTVCVRLCDGFFFPVSFSTLPNHFSHDADQCQSRCAAPVDLYYYQNPGADIKQAMSVKAQTPYTGLKTAFRYTKEYVHGCSCKEAEYVPAAGEKKAELPAPPAAPGAAPTLRQAARQPDGRPAPGPSR